MARLGDFLRRYVKAFQDDDVPGLGAELAYRFLFAVFPFGIFVAALGATIAGALGVDNPAEKVISALGDNLPKELAGTVQNQLQGVIDQARPSLMSLGALVALYAAAGGTNALIKAMNRAYDVEDTRGFVGRLVLAIGLTLLASAGLLAAFVTIVGGTMLTQQLAEQVGLSAQAWSVVTLLRWPVVFVMLTIAVAILYRLAPNVVAPTRWIVAGAALFSVAWLIVTFVFALYVANFANYGSTYGALGGVIALMLWFYLTSVVLVGAAEFVAVATEMTEPERLQARRDELGLARGVTDGARKVAEAAGDGVRRVKDGVEPHATGSPHATTRSPRSGYPSGGAK
jgi:membrane protein